MLSRPADGREPARRHRAGLGRSKDSVRMSTVLQPHPLVLPRRADPQVAEDSVLSRRRREAVRPHPASTDLAAIPAQPRRAGGRRRHRRRCTCWRSSAASSRRTTPTSASTAPIYVPPQPIYLVDDGKIYPHILGLKSKVDRETLRRTYEPDPYTKIPIQFFVKGDAVQPVRLHPAGDAPVRRRQTRTWASSCSGPTARGATSSRGC